jgi:hypothetical protein
VVWAGQLGYSDRVYRAALVICAVVSLSACRDGPGRARNIDGGRFELPDSGFFFDARPPPSRPDASVGDTGPYVCEAGCPDGSVCGCLDRSCGCHEPGRYNALCDLQHPETCGWPYQCVRAQTLQGRRTVCSDGRLGSSCSTLDSHCNTSNGCVCQMTPLGTACSCQGSAGMNPRLCDPRRPETCANGTCVRVETAGGVTHFCSQGERFDPCEVGDNSCRTQLGCTCPLYLGEEVCQCTEPGGEVGDPCDPRVMGVCAANLECAVIRDEQPGSFSTQCVGTGAVDGGTDPRACDPDNPLCPPLFECVEVQPGRFRCQPQR